jgi:uncharacterized protein (TIGR00290 family)
VKEKILLSWSGGKDSALALHDLNKSQQYDVAALVTTVTEDYDRISMHGVRRVLLEQQAHALGLPLEKVLITKNASNDEYEQKMRALLDKYYAEGIRAVAFGDIFLEDLKKYREDNLARVGMTGIFPLWKKDTTELARGLTQMGFGAITTCVDGHVLGQAFVGRLIDRQFLSELPPTVDPCGENGEFHSFTFAGPIFRERIPFAKGSVVLRDDRYYFCDLIPEHE